jgi:hypothetical protein
MMFRYFLWLWVYQVTTFYKQNPLSFLVGMITAPYFAVTRSLWPSSMHADMALLGIRALKEYWSMSDTILPPKFVERKFLKLEQYILALKRPTN